MRFVVFPMECTQELEVLTDPMRKEVAAVRKRIDMANRDLKPLGQSCQKKVFTLISFSLLKYEIFNCIISCALSLNTFTQASISRVFPFLFFFPPFSLNLDRTNSPFVFFLLS